MATAAALLERSWSRWSTPSIDLADGFADELDHIEEKVLADEIDEGRPVIGRVRRTTVRLHRQLVILRVPDAAVRAGSAVATPFGRDLPTSKMSQRLDWLDEEIVALRDRAQLLQEEITIKTGEQTNRNLHLLAVVTTIFMPAP